MEIMTTSMRLIWKIVLNVTVWLAIRLIFSFNHSVRKISTLDFHRAHAAIAAGQLAVEKRWTRTYTPWCVPTFNVRFYDHLSKF